MASTRRVSQPVSNTRRLPTRADRPQLWLDRLIDRPARLWLVIFSLFILVFAASIVLVPRRYGQLIIGDGIYYYVYLRSAVLDGDLDFTNDYTLYQQFNTTDPIKKREMLERKTPLGKPANLFSVGPAVLWSPVFLITQGVALLLGRAGDGFSFGYQAPLLFASITYGFIGILLIYHLAAGLFSRAAAFIAVLGSWLATNVVYYMGVSPSASHVLSLFASALFLYLWWRSTPLLHPSSDTGRRNDALDPSIIPQRRGRSRWGWFLWGLSAGLMALVRWQDVLMAVLAGVELIRDWRLENGSGPRTSPFKSLIANSLAFFAGLVLAFLPQMVAWQILYGAPLTAPQGAGFFQFLDPQLLNVWFSTKRGLFSWTPIIALAVIGFIPLYRRSRILGATALFVFLTESYVNSIVNDWWGGEAFGARRFISLIPFFALGLAALVDWLRPRISLSAMLTVLGAFILWNNLFILQYDLWLHGIGQISAQPTLAEITIDKFTAPFKVLERLGRR